MHTLPGMFTSWRKAWRFLCAAALAGLFFWILAIAALVAIFRVLVFPFLSERA